MKKLTIVLVIVTIITFGVCSSREETICLEQSITPQVVSQFGTNKQLSNYAGAKVRGSNVKALFSLVDTLNVQEVFPINIRYGDVLPDSYDWVVTTNTEILNSGDFIIRDSAYYEVVIQDQLPEGKTDGYLDTIAIRSYSEVKYKNNVSSSGEYTQNEI